MGEAENRQTAERVFRAINERDVSLFHDQFHAHSVIDFPQSGERIVGDENRRSVYSSFPGRANVTRILTGGDLAASYGHGAPLRTKSGRRGGLDGLASANRALSDSLDRSRAKPRSHRTPG